jgi:hypothetical protein
MNSKCKHTQLQMMDWFYDEQDQKDWDFDHVQQCRECSAYYQQLLKVEKNLPREPLEFPVPEDFTRKLEDQVRKERVRLETRQEKRRIFQELGVFPLVAFFLLMLMGSLFYNDIGPSFMQVQIVGLLVFPLIIPIVGLAEKKHRKGRDSYGS